MLRLAVFALSLAALSMQFAGPNDDAVFLAFRRHAATLTHFAVLRRTGVTEQLDLVVAMGSPQAVSSGSAWTWWSEDRQIGLFLQEKARADRVYFLAAEAGFPDCAARLERAAATDTVVSCEGEKSERHPNRKWVYDVRAKSLLHQFSYRPFAMVRIFPSPDGAVLVGSDRQELIAVRFTENGEPPFRILNDAEAKPWTARIHASIGTEGEDAHRVLYIASDKPPAAPAAVSIPRTTYQQFARLRPRRVEDGYGEGSEIQDTVGPWQRDHGRIWLAKSFYDGEGTTGVGGFGYFDEQEKKLHLFQPPEIVDWSVSAMSVGPNAVWMALVQNGEYGGSAGGLLRFDRQSGTVRKLALPDIAGGILQVGGKVLAATEGGAAVLNGDGTGEAARYFIDVTTDGRPRIVRATP